MERSDETGKVILYCDTCGKVADCLRRDVLDEDYNALLKPALWNCDECYEKKRARRLERRQR
ncbi:MAG: hypothetical protein HY709_07740 [Candidatus Latescibacteria bacterium]|nr:hypothetical protein [Candidatus Latescibacterota bacterium]